MNMCLPYPERKAIDQEHWQLYLVL